MPQKGAGQHRGPARRKGRTSEGAGSLQRSGIQAGATRSVAGRAGRGDGSDRGRELGETLGDEPSLRHGVRGTRPGTTQLGGSRGGAATEARSGAVQPVRQGRGHENLPGPAKKPRARGVQDAEDARGARMKPGASDGVPARRKTATRGTAAGSSRTLSARTASKTAPKTASKRTSKTASKATSRAASARRAR
jgi:hypothetical protein